MRRPRLSGPYRDLVTATTIARRIGQKPATVGNWTSRYPDFPAAVFNVDAPRGRGYVWPDVVAWLREHDRLPELVPAPLDGGTLGCPAGCPVVIVEADWPGHLDWHADNPGQIKPSGWSTA